VELIVAFFESRLNALLDIAFLSSTFPRRIAASTFIGVNFHAVVAI
jgi:hypothetical protein